MRPTRDRITLLSHVKALGCVRAVEIGTHLGAYAVEILNRTDVNVLFCIDPWDGDNFPRMDPEERYKAANAALLPFLPRGAMVRAKSLDVVQGYPDMYFHFIYIDADHKPEAIEADMQAWWPKCAPGGIFAGHDYNDRNGSGVKSAVREFFGDRDLPFKVTRRGSHKTWYHMKGKA